ncbi:divalent metal cation transporter [Catenovulum agarivorans]|uniref:divalent metal cation transporter n=1 Tax=Catenovulum agarivorans TaxID=1172192 RepID=UPI0003008904|nr:divalent metal cation transporter [Catenovulum agarivorans]
MSQYDTDTHSSESATLQALSAKPWFKRVPGYVKLSGPGWLQGAMTLGGGSAVTSLTIGATFGYELLWVQPIAMIIGCIMLFALSHQTLHTQVKPFTAMKKHVSVYLAWGWAIAAFASSIIWGFAHYPLSAGMLEEIIAVSTGLTVDSDSWLSHDIYLLILATLVWAGCAYTAWSYGSHGRAVKVFETGIKLLSGMIIIAFAWVVMSAALNGKINWGAVLSGFVPRSLPTDSAGVTVVMAALGSAVGINMTFIYGYTLLHKKWNKQHAELARYDIALGLVVPYFLVTSLISIAAAGAFFGADMDIQGKLSPVQAGTMFMSAGLDEVTSRLIFAFGILGMAVGSLVMHMLCCGSAAAAMFNWPEDGLKYKLALLAPTPAVLGVFYWSQMGPYLVVPTSAICGFLLPIAYIGWAFLNNNQAYLGDATPKGRKKLVFNVAMALCITAVLSSVVYSMMIKLG